MARLPQLTEEFGRDRAGLQLHEAAEDFYDRNEPVTADAFEIAAFWLALSMASLAGLRFLIVALRRRRRFRSRASARESLLDLCRKESDSASLLESLAEAERKWLEGVLQAEDVRVITDVLLARAGLRALDRENGDAGPRIES